MKEEEFCAIIDAYEVRKDVVVDERIVELIKTVAKRSFCANGRKIAHGELADNLLREKLSESANCVGMFVYYGRSKGIFGLDGCVVMETPVKIRFSFDATYNRRMQGEVRLGLSTIFKGKN